MTEQQKVIFKYIIEELKILSDTVLLRVSPNAVPYIPHRSTAYKFDTYNDIIISKVQVPSTLEHLIKFNITFSLHDKNKSWLYKDNTFNVFSNFNDVCYECDLTEIIKSVKIEYTELLELCVNDGGSLEFDKSLRDYFINEYSMHNISVYNMIYYFIEDDMEIKKIICELYNADIPFQLRLSENNIFGRVFNFNHGEINCIYDKSTNFIKNVPYDSINTLKLNRVI